jgi:crossover junction endodeoxyribonuclease RuvC
MSPPITILGIDPGSTVTGWAIVEMDGRSYRAKHHGAVKLKPADPFATKLLGIFEGIRAVIAAHNPDEVAIESPFVAKNANTALKIGEARAAAIVAAAQAGKPVYEFAPRLVKSAVAGNGNADKNQVARMVGVILRMPVLPTPADITDAYAIALTQCFRRESPMEFAPKVRARKR